MSTSTPKNDNNGKNGRDEYEEITLFTSEFETPEERAAEKSAGTPKEEKAAAEEEYAATAGDVSPTDIPEKPEDTAREQETAPEATEPETAPADAAPETSGDTGAEEERPFEPVFDEDTIPEDPFAGIATGEFDNTVTDKTVAAETDTVRESAPETPGPVPEGPEETAEAREETSGEMNATEELLTVEEITPETDRVKMFSETARIETDPAASTGEYTPVAHGSETAEKAPAQPSEPKTSKYEELHSYILEKQSAGNLHFRTATDIDIDKNIREAEDFVHQSEKREAAEAVVYDVPAKETAPADTMTATSSFESADMSDTMVRRKKKSRMKTYFSKEKTGEIDKGDLEMMLAFGLNPTTTQTIETSKMPENGTPPATPQEKTETGTTAVPPIDAEYRPDVGTQYYEYESDEQNKEVFSYYHRQYNLSKLRLWGAAILAGLLLLLENLMIFGIKLPAGISPFTSPTAFALTDVILAVLCTALVFDKLISAVRSAIKLKPEPELILVVGAFFLLLTTILVFAYGPENTVMKYGRMYNFPYAISILLAAVSDLLKFRREIYSFKIAASKKTKCVVERITDSGDTPEAKAFDEYLPASPLLYRVGRAKKISGFFKKLREYPKIKKILFIVVPAAVFAAFVMYLVDYFGNGTGTFQSFSALLITLQFCLPLSAFISFSYPLTHASAVAYEFGSAMIGDATVDRYTDASVISFDDTDVFPADRTKIRAVKVLENNRIDEVIYYAASVFSQLGGPLRSVFNLAMLDIGHSEDVEILDVSDKGVEARVDGKSIVIGQQSYLERQCFETVFEEGDDACSGKSSKRILYLACDNAVAAKIYIRYSVDPSFENILRRIYSAGMCVAVKSCDPNIDNALLSGKINLSKYPVRIIKCNSVDDMNKTKEESDSGIISTGSVRGILQALSLCDRLTHINRTNAVVKLLSVVLGVFSAALIVGSGVVSGVASLYLAAYQVFWIIPMLLLSKFYISASEKKEK